jgi:hypothetical protein
LNSRLAFGFIFALVKDSGGASDVKFFHDFKKVCNKKGCLFNLQAHE